MFYTDLHMFWARTPEGERVIGKNDSFDLHYAVYDFVEQSSEFCNQSSLLSHSFQGGPLSRSDIASSASPFSQLLTELLEGEYEVYYGQNSMWKAVQRGWTNHNVVM